MIYFGISAVFLILISYMIGSLVLYKLKIEKVYFSTPIGFLIFMALLQIFHYVYRFVGLSNNWFHYYFILLVILIIAIYIFNYKIILLGLKRIYKYRWYLLLSICLTMFLLFLFSNVDITIKTTDSIFYTKYVSGLINPSGIPVVYSNQYDYQVYYNLIASLKYWTGFLSKINLYTDVLVYPYMSWVMAIVNYFILSLTIVNIISIFVKKVKISVGSIIVSILVLSCSLLNSWTIITPYYGNSFRRIAICYLIYFLYEYIKNRKTIFLIMNVILFQSMISLSSSGLFLSIILLYSYLVYSLVYKKEGFIKELLILAFFPSLFAIVFIPSIIYGILPMYFIFVVLIVTRKISICEKFLFKIWWLIALIIPLIFTVVPYIEPLKILFSDIPKSFWIRPSYDFVPDLLRFSGYGASIYTQLFNLSYWLIIVVVIVIGIRKRNFISIMLLSTIVTFFNPFVHDFVYKFFTNIVFFRITDLFYNPLVISFIFFTVYNLVKNKLFKVFIIILYSCLIISSFQIYQFNVKTIENDDYNYIYHTTNNDIKLFEEFDKYLYMNDQKEEYKVISQAYGTGMFSKLNINNLFNWQTHYLQKLDETNFSTVFYRREPNSDDYEVDYNQACQLAYEKDAEYVIIDAQYNWQLESGMWPCLEKIFEVNNYRVFKIRYDMWEYNIKQGFVEDTRKK